MVEIVVDAVDLEEDVVVVTEEVEEDFLAVVAEVSFRSPQSSISREIELATIPSCFGAYS